MGTPRARSTGTSTRWHSWLGTGARRTGSARKRCVATSCTSPTRSKSRAVRFSVVLGGIRFFYHHTLEREWRSLDVAKPRYEKTLPIVLSREEVWRILDAVRIQVYRACLTTIYSCGLRLMEGCGLQIPDVDTAGGVLRIRGKGRRHRDVPLPGATLQLLRDDWRTHRSPS